MRKVNRCMIFILCFVFMLSMYSCKKEENIVINTPEPTKVAEKKDNDIKSSDNNEIEKKLVTMNIDSSIKYIKLVSVKNTDFWQAIEECSMDNGYNKESIYEGNIRLKKNVSEKYKDLWLKEIEDTYDALLEDIDEVDKEVLTKQEKSYLNYLENTSSIYEDLFQVGNEDDEMAGNKNIEGSYTEKLNKYRSYAIEEKEYYYLLNSDVYFAKSEQESDTKDIVDNKTAKDAENTSAVSTAKITASTTKRNYEIENKNEFNLVSNKKFIDTVNDHYAKKFTEFNNMFVKNSKEKEKAVVDAENMYDFWNAEVISLYEKLKESMNDTQRALFEKQYTSWTDYVTATEQLQTSIFKTSKIYESVFKDDVEYDVIMQKAYRVKQYTLELLQYQYLVSGNTSL